MILSTLAGYGVVQVFNNTAQVHGLTWDHLNLNLTTNLNPNLNLTLTPTSPSNLTL